MAANRKILISGAGISGLTLAYWLQKWGFEPSIVEKRTDLSERGYMIDFYGSGFDVAEKMDLTDALQAASRQYPIARLQFVNNEGKPRAELDVAKFKSLLNQRYFPLMRGDLENAIYHSVRETVPIRFNTRIQQLTVNPDCIAVDFSDELSETYDLVIGADGIHSNVRSLLWGREEQFHRALGFTVACSVIDNFLDKEAFYSHFEPNLQTTIYSIGQGKLATFIAFPSKEEAVRDRGAQMRILTENLDQGGWVVPQILEATRHAREFFFDQVAQIHLEHWYQNRVALVGDACQCLTLLAGQGASLGMAGAYLLAKELSGAAGNYQKAFLEYEQKLQPEILRRQKDARGIANSYVPRNKLDVWINCIFLRAFFFPGVRSLVRKQIGARSVIH